jgi:hypothetical protein
MFFVRQCGENVGSGSLASFRECGRHFRYASDCYTAAGQRSAGYFAGPMGATRATIKPSRPSYL